MSRLWTSVVLGALGALAAGAIVVGTSGGGVDEATASHGGIHVSAGQLKINQRISQAAVRRVNEATERLDEMAAGGEQPPEGEGGAEVLSAVVSLQGALVRGRGATDAADVNQAFDQQGVFEVMFDRDVTDCVYVANVGDPGEAEDIRVPAEQPGFVITAQRPFWPNRVLVETYHADSEPMRKGFHLTVTC